VFVPLISVFFLLAVLNFGVAWYYSGVLNDLALAVGEDKIEYDLIASAVGEGLVKLEKGPDDGEWKLPGKWGLSWDGGSGMIGDVVEYEGDNLVRRFMMADGDPPRSAPAFVSDDIYPNDPYLAFGIKYEEVEYETPLGRQDAWRFEGDDDTWAVFVHGHRGIPGDGLASLPVLHDLGIPALFITYRNDKGQPQDPSGIYQYGLTEWQDLHAAVEYALSQPGARDVVLIGHSMGGGIVVKFLYESPLASSVTGAVMDSPVMDFKAPVDLGARERNLPGFVTATVKWIATLRFGLDWDAMDYLKDADRLDSPILLIHGEDDTRVPIGTSDKLAELRPDLVTYSVYPDATHADAWNVDSGRYERELREFLLRVVK
jgi:pimeloyl-ACP methyl ester carboxylesterase